MRFEIFAVLLVMQCLYFCHPFHRTFIHSRCDHVAYFTFVASFLHGTLKIEAGGNCENFNVLSGHKNAILDVKFTNDSEKIITASADYHLGVFDSMTGTRIKRFIGHTGIVNAVDVCREGYVAFMHYVGKVLFS